MTTPTPAPTPTPVDGTSSERSRRVHMVRTLVIVVPILALTLLTGAMAAGISPIWPTDTAPVVTTPATPLADEAGLESAARPSPSTQTPIQVPAAPPTPTESRGATDVGAAPPSAGRLITGPAERIIDTRSTDAEAGPPDSTFALPAPGASVTGLVLSVSVLGAERAGTVTIEGSFGSIDVVTVGGPGATTTNGLVVVPGTEPSTLIHPTGGDLVVDLVGHFAASGPSAQGRLLPVEPIRLAELVTATDGRETRFSLDGSTGPVAASPSAALVVITADVGDDGGRVGIGPVPGQADQMLMWGPPSGDNRQRSGVVLVAPGPDGTIALRYDGGSVLTVDLIAQVTGDGAAVASAGLFVPVSTVETIDRVFPRGRSIVGAAPSGVEAAIVGLRATPGGGVLPQPAESATDLTVASGRTITTVLPVGSGADGGIGLRLSSSTELEARIQPLGYLLASTP